MEVKTVLELFKEKAFSNSLSSVKITREDDYISQFEDIILEVQPGAAYFLNERGRKLLEVLGMTENISILNSWLQNYPEFCADISCQLVEMVTKDFPKNEDKKKAEDIVKLILSSMINVGNYSLRELFALSSSVMETFTKTLIESLFSCGKDLKIEFLNKITNERRVFQEGMKSFAAFLLNSLLTHEPKSVTLQSALCLHHKQWTSEFIPVKFKSLHNQLEVLLTKEGVMQEIELVLDDGHVNLKHVLYAVSLMSQHSDQSDHLDIVKASADKWFRNALSERNEIHLGLALLITRHHFAEVSKYLVNYANWFSSLQTKNVLTFNFFFEFLTKLVPFEPAVFLKIQVTKVPSGPTSCQGIVNDYISLAKTRLLDMNQTYDYISLFNDFHETIEEQQESDVNRVLSHFNDNSEVSKAVLEASVFRKQYYEKVFLPCLLSVPRGSDKIRDQLIIKLNTMGKLPSSTYRVWSKSRQ